jgi:hypothetical protein
MFNPKQMSDSEIKQRIGVLLAVKASLEFSGRVLPEEDKTKFDALREELRIRDERVAAAMKIIHAS